MKSSRKKEVESNSLKELLEENRLSLETVQKAQDKIKSLERLVSEKNVMLRVLEDRLRPNLLERSLKDKDTTIKHLEMQIVKIIGENKILESKLAKAESENICKICRRNLVEPFKDQKRSSKSSVGHRSSSRPTSVVLDKKSMSNIVPQCPDRIKMLERIVSHKDERIAYLSKEVQRLSEIEKELINKVNRLSKLLPASHLSSEKLTECLLREIQLLEAQIQSYKDSHCRIIGKDDSVMLKSFADPVLQSMEARQRGDSFESLDTTGIGKALTDRILQKQIDRLDWELKASAPEYDVIRRENEALQSYLRKLYRDIYELKFFLSEENEKMRQEIDGVSLKSDVLKVHWQDVIDRLNDISNNIVHITESVPDVRASASSDRIHQTESKERESTISRLQKQLRDTLELVTEYETENKSLKVTVSNLKEQLDKKDENHNFSVSLLKKQLQEKDAKQSLSEVKIVSSITSDDLEKLKDILSIKQAQLDAADRHIKMCEKSIEELQKLVRHLESENSTLKSDLHLSQNDQKLLNTQRELEYIKKQLEIKNRSIESLQTDIRNFEIDNSEFQAKLHVAESKNVLAEVTNQQKMSLEKKLNAAEKHVNSYESSVEKLQITIQGLEEEKSKLQDKLNVLERQKLSYDSNEHHMVSLQTELIKIRDENQNLRQSLLEFENKAQEMNHYRNILHKEIENLCCMLTDSAEDTGYSSQRRAIYRAAVLHSAQALLRLDQNFNPKGLENTDALNEMKHQIQVYVSEVARIHELLTIKEQQRDHLLKEYLSEVETETSGEKTVTQMYFEGESEGSDLESTQSKNKQGREEKTGSHTNDALNSSIVDIYRKGSQSPNAQAFTTTTIRPESRTPSKISYTVEVNSSNKIAHASETQSYNNCNNTGMVKMQFDLMNVKDELVSARSLSSYLMSSCTRLEEALEKERIDHAKADFEMQALKENVKELNCQIQKNNSVTKRLNTLIDMLRSRENNDDITMEQLKSEIKWLMDENQKTFERITSTQSELSECKEVNSRAQNEIDVLKRQLLNEKYEHAKVNNDLKILRQQITNSDNDRK